VSVALEKLPGDPGALRSEVDALDASVSAIEDAIDLLNRTEVALDGRAAVALYGRSLDAATELDAALDRYGGTASALRTYVIEMEVAHADADAAVQRSVAALGEQTRAVDSLASVRHVLSQAQANGALESRVAELEDQVYYARRRVDRADDAVDEVVRAWEAARDRQETAARTAAAQIHDAMSSTNNGFWDDVGGFFAAIGDAYAAVGTWMLDAVKALGEFLAQYAGILLVFLVILAVVLIFTALTFGVALLVAAAIFAVIAGVLLVASLFAESGGGPYPGADYPVEVRSADPENSGSDSTEPSYSALFERDLTTLDDYTSKQPIFDAEGNLVDAQSRDDLASMVRVVALRDEDTGEIVGWRVELPSTQDWGLTGNSMNDLPTNALHALMPWKETEMEEAAWDAMDRAGVLDSGAPVMLTGWSQGGMTAGELAIDDRLAGRDLSVVSGGSPVDCFRNEFAERGVRVTSFTHSDVVSGLEGLRLTPADFTANNPEFVEHFDWTPVHSAKSYAAMAAETEPALRPGDEVFFADFGKGVVEEVHLFEYTRHEPDTILAPGAPGVYAPGSVEWAEKEQLV
jgi:hypothetical protein